MAIGSLGRQGQRYVCEFMRPFRELTGYQQYLAARATSRTRQKTRCDETRGIDDNEERILGWLAEQLDIAAIGAIEEKDLITGKGQAVAEIAANPRETGMGGDEDIAGGQNCRNRVAPLRLAGEVVDMLQHLDLFGNLRCKGATFACVLLKLFEDIGQLRREAGRIFLEMYLYPIQTVIAERPQKPSYRHRAQFQPVGNGGSRLER